MFSIMFDNPDMVSIGSKPDRIRIRIVNPAFFASANSGSAIDSYDIISVLPTMFRS